MTAVEPEEVDQPPVAHVSIVYLGPVAPHWELRVHYGDQNMLDGFWTRVNARLLLLPKHDPQFRRNRERVNRDAERELIICDWDLGEDDAESTQSPVRQPVEAQPVEAQPVEGEVPSSDEASAPVDPSPAETPTSDDALVEP